MYTKNMKVADTNSNREVHGCGWGFWYTVGNADHDSKEVIKKTKDTHKPIFVLWPFQPTAGHKLLLCRSAKIWFQMLLSITCVSRLSRWKVFCFKFSRWARRLVGLISIHGVRWWLQHIGKHFSSDTTSHEAKISSQSSSTGGVSTNYASHFS